MVLGVDGRVFERSNDVEDDGDSVGRFSVDCRGRYANGAHYSCCDTAGGVEMTTRDFAFKEKRARE